jgi:hypothetical protein
MSQIYAHVWMMGAPKCCSAHCDRLILDHSQAVVVVRSGGNAGFCSPRCFLEAFGRAPDPQPSSEAKSDQDLLHRLGYRYPHEESDPV